MTEDRIKVGISTCLLGQRVRYDGGHKRDPFLVDTLGQYLDYIPVCPEVECGFPVPREAFRLVGDPAAPRLMTVKTKQDVTERMETWAKKRVQELEAENLCGFIFKSKSPSSGMERVKVYTEKGMPSKSGVGVFARIFKEHFPRIPTEEEGRLHDPMLRENFIERLFALKRWRTCVGSGGSRGDLVDFHTRHKLLILSHSPSHYRTMGRLVARNVEYPIDQVYDEYEGFLLDALRLKTTLKKNINVLMHIMGYFKKIISADEKAEILEIIDQYRNGFVPLIVPITLFNHYVRKYEQSYLMVQTFLNPHPVALKLRNHA